MTAYQLEELSERKTLDIFLDVNTQTDQNYLISKPKSPRQSRRVRLGKKWKKMQPEQKVINPQDIKNKSTNGSQHQRKLHKDTQRRRTIFVFGKNSLAEKISVLSSQYRKHTVKKDKRKIKNPRK